MTNSQQRIPSNRVARSLYYFLHESVPFLRNGNNEVATVLDLTRRFISPPVEYVIFEQAPSDLLARSVSFPVSWARTCMCAWFSRCSCTRHERVASGSGAAVIRKSRVKKKHNVASPCRMALLFLFSFLSRKNDPFRPATLSPTSSRSRLRSTTARASERVLRFKNRRGHTPTRRSTLAWEHGFRSSFPSGFPFGFHSIRRALAKIAAVIPPEDVPGKGTSLSPSLYCLGTYTFAPFARK